MRRPGGGFMQRAVLFLMVVVPLAMAEGVWWYLAASVLAVAVGGWTQARRRKPLLGPMGSRVFVLAAFGLLLIEYVWLVAIPVMALSHFMTLACASKFLQDRTLRDDAQLAVLCLLLLVVASIVSGNVIFVAVVLVYLSVGFDLLLRFNLSLERARVERANLGVDVVGGPPVTADVGASAPIGGAVLLVALSALLVGVGMFTFFPRVGAGMFGRPDARGGGMAVTGFSTDIDFETIGPITESQRPIMRVQVDVDGKPVSGPDTSLYLRGRVFDFYGRRRQGGRGWDWQPPEAPRTRVLDHEGAAEEEFNLLPDYRPPAGEQTLNQRYTIELGAISDPVLFSLYPPVAVGGINFDEVNSVTKSLEDQSLRMGQMRRILRYTVRSAPGLSPAVVKALEAERDDQRLGAPRIRPPRPPLPGTDRIRDLSAPLEREAGPLNVPENRARFAESLESWLRSGRLRYTLDPPSPRPDTEPISEFLLNHRRGCCQHFASAMVVMCQLAGVPARLVSGFRCEEYNSMGRFWSVRGKHAHAWVEVYIPGRDWVRYDPTPAATEPRSTARAWLLTLRGYGDFLQFQWGNLVLAYDADQRRYLLTRFGEWLMRPASTQSTLWGKVAAFARELFVWRVQMSWQDRLLYWVFALLIVALVVLIGYVVLVLTWRGVLRLGQWVLSRRAGAQRTGDAVFYHRLCRRLSALGLRRRPEQTPAEFAADLAVRYPALQPATELVGAYYEVIYGQRGLSSERRTRFEEFLRKLDSVDRTALCGS